jgi:hypothetical protein
MWIRLAHGSSRAPGTTRAPGIRLRWTRDHRRRNRARGASQRLRASPAPVALVKSGHRILDKSAGRLAANGDREQMLPGGDVGAGLVAAGAGRLIVWQQRGEGPSLLVRSRAGLENPADQSQHHRRDRQAPGPPRRAGLQNSPTSWESLTVSRTGHKPRGPECLPLISPKEPKDRTNAEFGRESNSSRQGR